MAERRRHEEEGPREKGRPNPFGEGLARANSSYAAYRGNRLVSVPSGEPAAPLAELVHGSLRALVLNPGFSCVGAKSALRGGRYRVGVYGEMASPGATAGLARDLFEFVEEQPYLGDGFSTYLASFAGPNVADEAGFEELLWAQLQGLHDLDLRHHAWDPSVSPDPEDADFSFSFGGRAFFVVGLHPASSRFARRFAWPTLAFNAHEQFEKLREKGRFARIQEVVRTREVSLQGGLNPNLGDFGELPEARQYSGRRVERDWRCPFRHGGPEEDEENPSSSS